MKAFYFLLSTLFTIGTVLPLWAQPLLEWERTYGGTGDDRSETVRLTPDGGYLIMGNSASFDNDVNSNNGSSDYWAFKITENGTLQWEKNYGGSGQDIARSIRLTNDGGYILAGSSPSPDGDVSNNYGNFDYWVIKTDATGNIEWEKNYGGPENDRGWIAIQTNDGGYIVGGHASSEAGDVSANYGANDCWLAKTDSNGTIQWEQNYGGSDLDRMRALQLTADGGYVFCGFTNSSDVDVGGNNGGDDFWVVKVDANGQLLWEHNYGGSANETARAIRTTQDNGFIVVGNTVSTDGDVSTNNGQTDFWVIKLDANGLLEWENAFGGSNNETARSVWPASDGGYLVVGESNSVDGDVSGNNGGNDVWIIKTTPTGNLDWELHLGGTADESARSIKETSDGYILTGYTTSNDGDVSSNYGTYDVWVIKLSNCTPQVANPTSVHECEDNPDSGVATFNLHLAETDLVAGIPDSVLWYTDPAGSNLIADPGNYISATGTVYAQVFNPPCASDIVAVEVTVHPAVAPPVSLSGATNACPFQQEIYLASPVANADNYTWTLPPGATPIGPIDLDNISIDWGNSSGGELCVAAANACGPGDSICVNIVVNSTTTGTDSGSYCEGGSFTFPGNGQSYTAGNHNITLTGGNTNGCDSIVMLNVTSLTHSFEQLDISLCEGDPPVEVNGQLFDQTGTYLIDGMTNYLGCDSTVSLNLEVTNGIPMAEAGADAIICDDVFPLNGNLPPNTFGTWTSTSSQAVISNPDSPNTLADSLLPGDHEFIWTISHPECGWVAADTVVVVVEERPEANDDHFATTFEEPSDLAFNLLDNDLLSGSSSPFWEILQQPEGTLTDLGDGQYQYQAPVALQGTTVLFDYILCNQQCIDGCDTASVSIVLAESFFPNTITPNGDGINDVFVIPDLEDGPEQFPIRDLTVFNRWGDLVFRAKPYLNDWGGTDQNGRALPQGTYYYVLRISLGEGIIYRGDVTVLR